MSNVGQNMAAMTGGELTGEKVSSMWYEEEGSYNYNKPGFSSSTGKKNTYVKYIRFFLHPNTEMRFTRNEKIPHSYWQI